MCFNLNKFAKIVSSPSLLSKLSSSQRHHTKIKFTSVHLFHSQFSFTLVNRLSFSLVNRFHSRFSSTVHRSKEFVIVIQPAHQVKSSSRSTAPRLVIACKLVNLVASFTILWSTSVDSSIFVQHENLWDTLIIHLERVLFCYLP